MMMRFLMAGVSAAAITAHITNGSGEDIDFSSLPLALTLTNADCSSTTGYTMRYGSLPLVVSGSYAHSGTAHFAAGNVQYGIWDQDTSIPVDAYEMVDSGGVIAVLKAWRAGYTDDDTSGLKMEFLDADGNTIGSKWQPKTDVGNTTTPAWSKHFFRSFLPKGTRTIRWGAWQYRAAGTESSTYFDDFELEMIHIDNVEGHQVLFLTPISTDISGLTTDTAAPLFQASNNTSVYYGFPGLGANATGNWYKDVAFDTTLYDLIDSGDAKYEWNYLTGQYVGGADLFRCTVQFYDALGAAIVHDVIQTSAAAYTSLEQWEAFTLRGAVPVGARSMRMTYEASGASGTNRDAYIAHMSFWIVRNHIPVTSAAPVFLDSASIPVTSAWGLRRIISTYYGPLIRIRDTDGERDLYQDKYGWLEDYTPNGTAYVTRIYNQYSVGTGDDLVQKDEAKQGILTYGFLPSGRPAIKFDGVNDYMYGEFQSTTRPYMVPYPSAIFMGWGGTPREDYCTIWKIPQIAGANTSPYGRFGINCALSGTGATPEISTRFGSTQTQVTMWMSDVLTGPIAMYFGKGRLYEVPLLNAYKVTSTTSNTYPSNTSMYIAANGAGEENWGGYFSELTMFSGDPETLGAYDTMALLAARSSVQTLFGANNLYRLYGSESYHLNSYGIGELQLRGQDSETDITTGGWVASDMYYNTSEYGKFATDDNLTTKWSTGSWKTSGAYLGLALTMGVSPVEGDITLRNDAYYLESVKTFTLQKMTRDGWVSASSITLSASVTAGATYAFNLDWPSS